MNQIKTFKIETIHTSFYSHNYIKESSQSSTKFSRNNSIIHINDLLNDHLQSH